MVVDAPIGIFSPTLLTGSESVSLPLSEASSFYHSAEHADSTAATFSGSVNLPKVRSRSTDVLTNCITNSSINSVEEHIYSLLHQQHSIVVNIFAETMKKLREQHILDKTNIESVANKLIAKTEEKDREIRRVTEINGLLQEKMKCIWEENRLLRDSSLINEAAANSFELKYNQILAEYIRIQQSAAAAWEEDAGSCCNENERVEILDSCKDYGYNISHKYLCKICGKRESSVLLIPCRHLCLCSICGSILLTCPLCNSHVSGSVRVNNL